MEQKKTLWIIAGVSIFLLVVFGVAFIAVKPVKNNAPVFAKRPAIEKKAPAESGWSNPPLPPAPIQNNIPSQNTELSTAKVNDMVVVSENTTVYDVTKAKANDGSTGNQTGQSTTIDLNALKRELTAELAAQVSQGQVPQNINITVTMPDKKAEQPIVIATDESKDKSSSTGSTSSAAANVKKPAEPAAKSTVAKATPAKSTAKAETKPAQKAQATAPAPKPVSRFWVQVAAYTNKKTAENAREVLSSNKISSDIFTYQDNKNRLFYRVRVGPYTTKSEAEYWQAKISKISDFSKEQSFVTSD